MTIKIARPDTDAFPTFVHDDDDLSKNRSSFEKVIVESRAFESVSLHC